MKLAISSKRPRRTLDDALLPLVNIVFLLMVFFLFAGHWAGAAAPRSQGAAPVRAADAVLELKADAQMQLGEERFADEGLASRAVRLAGRALDLRAEANVSASRVLRTMAVLQEAGVKDLRLLAVRDRGAP